MMIRTTILRTLMALMILCVPYTSAYATCCGEVSTCDGSCTSISASETEQTIAHTNQEFVNHREWMVKVFFEQHVLPAMQLMAEQLTAMAMHQIMIVGALLDAKHQLETQRLFQQLMAEAHKDYQPSEGMCTFGTVARSLAASERKGELTSLAIAARGLQRELLSGDAVSGGGQASDYLSRIQQFRSLYCNQQDNGGGLGELCPQASADKARMDNDINYTNVVDAPLTLKLDFTPEGQPYHASNPHSQAISADEEDLLALMSNLYAHKVSSAIPSRVMVGEDGTLNTNATDVYMDIRAVAAKRSVARNSIAAIASMKSQGKEESEPYLHAILKEMGITDEEEIQKYIGDRPSYYAQMEILTKKLYQNPLFYTELYDKPANIDRKTVAMQAIELMQKRDIYRSALRSEATLSVMLETALESGEEEKVLNEIYPLSETADVVKMPY